MATYSAYRHVELDNVGYGKKRVLKPPGGGSSDIFGASSDETSPRRVKPHNQSQLGSTLFSNESNGSAGSNGSTGNSSPESPRVNKPDGTDSASQSVTSSSASINGDTKTSMNSSPTSGSQPRTRVPPGGYSSGLW